MNAENARPTLAVWKLASCDGCQLVVLDLQDELLTLAGEVDITHFTEATSTDLPGPYDVSLVEGSVTTSADQALIPQIRTQSRTLVTIGACATAGAERSWPGHPPSSASALARPQVPPGQGRAPDPRRTFPAKRLRRKPLHRPRSQAPMLSLRNAYPTSGTLVGSDIVDIAVK